MQKNTVTGKNSTFRATPNRINVDTHPMPNVRRGASSSSNNVDMQDIDYMDSNQTRRSMNGAIPGKLISEHRLINIIYNQVFVRCSVQLWSKLSCCKNCGQQV